MERKFNIGDTVICIDGEDTAFEVGDILTIKGDEAFNIYNECGYSCENTHYMIMFKHEHKFKLYDYSLPYYDQLENEQPSNPSELECFMNYLKNQDNLSNFEFQLVRRYEWFKNNKE